MRTNLKDQFDAEQRAAFKPKIIARNTFRFTCNGETVIRLHATDVARKLPNGSVILDSGGWRTVTTKDRMNGAMPAGYSLFQDKGAWFIVKHVYGAYWNGPRVPYFDGINVPGCFKGSQKRPNAELAKQVKLRKAINLFCKKLDGLKVLPEPSQGDCWLCCLRDKAGKTMGEHGRDTDHLLEHVKEGYLHGSLLYNALQYAGYRNPAFVWQMENHDRQNGRRLHNGGSVKRALRRYLLRKLGLAA